MHPNWRYPPRRPAIRTALRGSAVAGVLLEVLRESFENLSGNHSWYLSVFPMPAVWDAGESEDPEVSEIQGLTVFRRLHGFRSHRCFCGFRRLRRTRRSHGIRGHRRLSGSGRPTPQGLKQPVVTGSHIHRQSGTGSLKSCQPGTGSLRSCRQEPGVSETTNREPGI